MLERTVDDWSHRLLHGSVLRVDPYDSGERLVLLHEAILHPVVVLVSVGSKGFLIHRERTVGLVVVLIRAQRCSHAVGPVEDHRIVIVDWDPPMAVDDWPG